jgi:hypothetical protein
MRTRPRRTNMKNAVLNPKTRADAEAPRPLEDRVRFSVWRDLGKAVSRRARFPVKNPKTGASGSASTAHGCESSSGTRKQARPTRMRARIAVSNPETRACFGEAVGPCITTRAGMSCEDCGGGPRFAVKNPKTNSSDSAPTGNGANREAELESGRDQHGFA